MDRALYDVMANAADQHWWWVGRRRIVSAIVKSLKLPSPQSALILDVGCGTGSDMAMLRQFGIVCGMDADEEILVIPRKKNLGEIRFGSLPYGMPFKDRSFNLVAMLDVLEHLDDDIQSLREIEKIIAPGGYLILTTPAYPFLWSKIDKELHHKRRYIRSGLAGVVTKAGMNVRFVSYINSFLFPLALTIRLIDKIFGSNFSQESVSIPSPLVNRILTFVYSIESRMLQPMAFPFGLSVLLVAQKSGKLSEQ